MSDSKWTYSRVMFKVITLSAAYKTRIPHILVNLPLTKRKKDHTALIFSLGRPGRVEPWVEKREDFVSQQAITCVKIDIYLLKHFMREAHFFPLHSILSAHAVPGKLIVVFHYLPFSTSGWWMNAATSYTNTVWAFKHTARLLRMI